MSKKCVSKISNLEFKRRYFNKVLIESFAELHHKCIETVPGDADYEKCKEGARVFFNKEMNLDKSTIAQTKAAILENGTYFTRQILEAAEEMADTKEKEILSNGGDVAIPENPEMSDEDKAIMDVIFSQKCPEDEIDTIRNATATALYAENKKADELKQALDIVSSESDNTKNLQETINNLTSIGPTSLMNAIISTITENVVKSAMNESAGSAPPADIIKSYADTIKNESMMVYCLYECVNGFGFKKYSNSDVEKIAYEIYNDK